MELGNYHSDSGVDKLVGDIIEDLRGQRRGYYDGSEKVEPIGRARISGLNYRDVLHDAVMANFWELGVDNVEELEGETVINFIDGRRVYHINMDGLAKLYGLEVIQLNLGHGND